MNVALSLCVIFSCIFVVSNQLKLVNDFRCDYQYVPEVDGWLKFHRVPANWYDARLRCHLEGTTLASPLHPDVQEAILSISSDPGLPGMDIFTGIHSTFSHGDFYSIEGVPLSAIFHTWAPGEPDNLKDNENCIFLTSSGNIGDTDCDSPRPYVCYRKNDEELVLNECGTTDDAYTMHEHTGSCYKLHRTPRVYARAYMACAAEGGYLAIINSEGEADFIRKLFAQNPASSMIGSFYKDVAYLGFNDWNEHGEWLTIHGETLQKAGYSQWSSGEPNNLTGEFCGAAYRSANLLDVRCDTEHAFICEKSPISLLRD